MGFLDHLRILTKRKKFRMLLAHSKDHRDLFDSFLGGSKYRVARNPSREIREIYARRSVTAKRSFSGFPDLLANLGDIEKKWLLTHSFRDADGKLYIVFTDDECMKIIGFLIQVNQPPNR